MYVVMGYTRGDDLFHSEAKPLFASSDRGECEAKLVSIKEEGDAWLAKYGNTVSPLQQGSLWARFSVVETPF